MISSCTASHSASGLSSTDSAGAAKQFPAQSPADGFGALLQPQTPASNSSRPPGSANASASGSPPGATQCVKGSTSSVQSDAGSEPAAQAASSTTSSTAVKLAASSGEAVLAEVTALAGPAPVKSEGGPKTAKKATEKKSQDSADVEAAAGGAAQADGVQLALILPVPTGNAEPSSDPGFDSNATPQQVATEKVDAAPVAASRVVSQSIENGVSAMAAGLPGAEQAAVGMPPAGAMQGAIGTAGNLETGNVAKAVTESASLSKPATASSGTAAVSAVPNNVAAASTTGMLSTANAVAPVATAAQASNGNPGGDPGAGGQQERAPIKAVAAGVIAQSPDATNIANMLASAVQASGSAAAQGGSSASMAAGQTEAGRLPVDVSQGAGHAQPAPAGSAEPQNAAPDAGLMASMRGSEMRIGMRSDEWGSISIATTISPGGVAAQIALDHGGLSHLLSGQVPAMEERLSAGLGVTARVEVRDMGTGGGMSQNPGQRSGGQTGSSAGQSGSSEPVSLAWPGSRTDAATPGVSGGRLSILA